MSLTSSILSLLTALALGSLLGLEREYRQKPAGFRTIALISVASALFTLLSQQFGGTSPDRVASNVLTGIGFIGAGIIFREGGSVRGLTTAATVWASASLGMAAGVGAYQIAWVGLAIMLVILEVFEWLQQRLFSSHYSRKYVFVLRHPAAAATLEHTMRECQLKFKIAGKKYDRANLTLQYLISGKARRLAAFEERLHSLEGLDGFEY